MRYSAPVVWLSIVALISSASSASAQEAVVIYADDINEIVATDGDGPVSEIDIGSSLDNATVISTRQTGLELELEPSGNIVRMDFDTVLSIDSILVEEEAVSHSFEVSRGGVRSVVALLSNDFYSLRTPTSAMGVRGTDFTVKIVSGESEIVIVDEGQVEVTRQSDDARAIVPAGQIPDTRDRELAPRQVSPERRNEELSRLQFVARDPSEVPVRREYGPGGSLEGRPRPVPLGGETRELPPTTTPTSERRLEQVIEQRRERVPALASPGGNKTEVRNGETKTAGRKGIKVPETMQRPATRRRRDEQASTQAYGAVMTPAIVSVPASA